MTTPSLEDVLQRLIADDPELCARLREEGYLPHDAATVSPAQMETIRVVRTLVRELEINWPGVEVVLRLRAELIDTRRQVSELARVLREVQQTREP